MLYLHQKIANLADEHVNSGVIALDTEDLLFCSFFVDFNFKHLFCKEV